MAQTTLNETIVVNPIFLMQPMSRHRAKTMLEFIDTVHGTLDLAKFVTLYMETIPRLVRMLERRS